MRATRETAAGQIGSVTAARVGSPDPGWARMDCLGVERSERAADIAARLLESDGALQDPRWRRRLVAPGLGTGPAFIFEDHSEIPMSPHDSHTLEYRMAWLAAECDTIGLAGERVPAFERYLADDLALGRFSVVAPESPSGEPLARRFARDRVAGEALVRKALRGGLTIVPYISTRSVWLLAELLAERTGEPVRVAGPPPDLTERVNNKAWFAQRVRELLGPEALPETHVASDERELKAHLCALATGRGRVVVKVPSGSGGRGIVTFETSSVSSDRVEATVRWLQGVLAQGGWDRCYPLVIGSWAEPVVGSPSAQVWIPHPEEGTPIVQAVFEQRLKDTRFVGGSTSELPTKVQDRLRDDAGQLAGLFQRLGYFGRCSFDAVLVGSNPTTARIHWLECNGRWGSASTALAAIERVIGPGGSFVVVQSEASAGPERSFEEVVAILGGDSVQRRGDGTGALILSPHRVMQGTGLNLAVIEASPGEARRSATRLLERFRSNG